MTTWIHSKAVFTHPDRDDLVVEGDRKEGEIDWNFSDFLLKASIAGWKLKSKVETKTPNLSVEP